MYEQNGSHFNTKKKYIKAPCDKRPLIRSRNPILTDKDNDLIGRFLERVNIRAFRWGT